MTLFERPHPRARGSRDSGVRARHDPAGGRGRRPGALRDAYPRARGRARTVAGLASAETLGTLHAKLSGKADSGAPDTPGPRSRAGQWQRRHCRYQHYLTVLTQLTGHSSLHCVAR
jgi:hypothetical protein